MTNLNSIDSWKNQLGLLPINLFSSELNNKFILLNGGIGDFCIDLKSDKTPDDYNSYAWSSNTKNFLTINDNSLFLYNWLKDKEGPYELNLISQHIDKFYDYLLLKSYKSEYDIVPFIINIYKSLRNLTDEKEEGVRAINCLLLLLATYEEGGDFKQVDLNKWNIPNIDGSPNLDFYFDEFKRGINFKTKNLKPNVDLILRHSAGNLFQEALKEAIFLSRDADLFGFYDPSYKSRYQLFSSFHYTPSSLARSIVEYSLSNFNLQDVTTLKIFDPACGSSEFLLEVLKQLKTLNFSGKVEIIGLDRSESAVNISNFLLAYEKREWQDRLTFKIKPVDNSLTEDWDNDYDLILMNPPFLSWELMDKCDRDVVMVVLDKSARLKPNLASAFICKAIKHLKPNGVLGTVMPTSMLLSDSYKTLRNEIRDNLSLLLVGKLGNYVFEYALTDVSILIGRKPQSNEIPVLLWTMNEKGIVNEAFRDLRKINYGQIPYVKDKNTYNIYKPIEYPIHKENWKVLSYNEECLMKHLKSLIDLNRLKIIQDIFSVKQGVRTGNNQIFKITNEFYNTLPPEEKQFFRPAIDNDSIKNGSIITFGYIWYPYDHTGLLISTEEELEKKVPNLYQQLLLPNKTKLINRARKNESNWWILSEHRAWLREKYPKLISTEFGKSGSFAFDNKGEFVVERGNGWIPKKEFSNNDYYYFYLSIFNSPFFNTMLSIYSKELLKGWDLGKKYTKDIPIPEITDELRNSFVFEKLVHFGKQITEVDFYNIEIIDDYLKKYIYKIDLNI